MTRRSPAPDLMRSIYLLWGHHPAPGRSGLTVTTIVRAGIEVADAGGLEALSMRKVADHIGAGTMSLYAHVPSKDDLTALMIDTVYAELYDNDVDAATNKGDWRSAMTFVAERNWDLYTRHQWLLDLRSARPTLGPNAMRKFETELRPLEGIGLSDIAMDSALNLILSHVETTCRAGRRATHTQDDSHMSDAQWWGIVAPVLDQVIDDDTLVSSSRVGMSVGAKFNSGSADSTYALKFGLDTILDGIQAGLGRTD